MIHYTLPDGRVLAGPQAFEHDGINYPGNWLDLATLEERHALGIIEADVAMPVLPSAVDAERDHRLATFTFQGKVYDFLDGKSDAAIARASVLAFAAIINGKTENDLRWANSKYDFAWILHDNTAQPLDAQTMFALGQAAEAWKSAHIFKARALKNMSPIPANYAAAEFWP